MIRYARLLEKDFRVGISERFVQPYKVLAIDNSTKIFHDSISLFVFAASLGFKHSKKLRFERKSSNLLRLQPLKDRMLSTMYSIMFKGIQLDELVEYFNDDFLSRGLKSCEEFAEAGMEILMEKVFKNHYDGTYLFSLPPTTVLDIYQLVAHLNFPEYFSEQEKTLSKVKLLLSPGYREEIRTQIISLNFEQDMLLSERIIEASKTVYFIDHNDEIVSNQVDIVASARNETDNKYRARFELISSKIKDLNEISLVIVDSLTQIREMNKTYRLILAINDDLL